MVSRLSEHTIDLGNGAAVLYAKSSKVKHLHKYMLSVVALFQVAFVDQQGCILKSLASESCEKYS